MEPREGVEPSNPSFGGSDPVPLARASTYFSPRLLTTAFMLSDAVAVGTDDVALRDLLPDLCDLLQPDVSACLTDVESLVSSNVIEVHHVVRVEPAAIRTRSRLLQDPDVLNELLPKPRIVPLALAGEVLRPREFWHASVSLLELL